MHRPADRLGPVRWPLYYLWHSLDCRYSHPGSRRVASRRRDLCLLVHDHHGGHVADVLRPPLHLQVRLDGVHRVWIHRDGVHRFGLRLAWVRRLWVRHACRRLVEVHRVGLRPQSDAAGAVQCRQTHVHRTCFGSQYRIAMSDLCGRIRLA
ncbi:MAG: hypothetical protein DWI23_08310 [Planctomycetota bacterium]|nr:MAG: hypothetical protein DWI23_08310 [Planctomycetota bacterium]